MQRIANGTQVASMPPRAAPVGTPGYGTNGDPGAGQLGSIFGADEFNPLQEELMAFLAAAGIAPDGNNNAQVLAAVRSIFGNRSMISLTTAGTTSQTVPAWARTMRARVWAAGGGGGGCSAAGAASGGGGGEYREGFFSVTPGASVSCTVGAGGTRGLNNPTNGGTGGSSSVGAFVTAIGGGGGVASGGGVQTTPGLGGTGGSGGTFVQAGASSQQSYQIGSLYNCATAGGSYGSGYSAFIVASNGNDGWAPGVGGMGGANGPGLGGNGLAGRIILEFYP